MSYQDAISFANIARPSWTGFYLDTARQKLVYRHADSKEVKEIDFHITPAELVATDWEFVINK